MMLSATSTITTRRLALSILFLTIVALSSATRLPALQFVDYVPTEIYRASSFLNASVDDKVMKAVYRTVNVFIASISRPLPHQTLIKRNVLMGDYGELLRSFTERYPEWISFNQWFLLLAVGCVLMSIVFTLVYLLYLCCRCCCTSSDDEKKLVRTDSRHDACRRMLLNVLLAVLLLTNIFSVTIVLISWQYAHEGARQLMPTRMNRLVDDMVIYKRDNDMRLRKLLITDYRQLNDTVMNAIGGESKYSMIVSHFADTGKTFVGHIKKLTGAAAMDSLIELSKETIELDADLVDMQDTLNRLDVDISKLRADFNRLKKTAEQELTACVSTQPDPFREYCERAQQMLADYDELTANFDDFAFNRTAADLNRFAESNVSVLFADAQRKFAELERALQTDVETNQNVVRNKMKQIGDQLFQIYEKISLSLRQISFDNLYRMISAVSDPIDGYRLYTQYIWIGGLVFGCVLALIVAIFGLGLFYGCCGRRPTYYQTDCCVRSTGSRLYCCANAMSILFLVALMSITTAVFLLVGNSASLVCHPLRDPFQRPDMIAMAERYLDIWKRQQQQLAPNQLTLLLDEHNVSDIIDGCYHNRTLYEIFALDSEYHLRDLKGKHQEAFRQLAINIDQVTAGVHINESIDGLVTPAISAALEQLRTLHIAPIPESLLTKLADLIRRLQLADRTRQLADEMALQHRGNEKTVTRIIGEIRQLDNAFARPITMTLTALHANLTELNGRLPNMTAGIPMLLGKLQHANALLASDLSDYVRREAVDVAAQLKSHVDAYLEHVARAMHHDVSSCQPLRAIAVAGREALCQEIIDPLNGFWASALICLLLLMPIIMITTSLRRLYANTDAYIQYVVEHPSRVNAFMTATDTYDNTYRRISTNGTAATKRDQTLPSGGHGARRYTTDVGSNAPPPYTTRTRY